jgi:2-polyprenyl-3-methyl-5-hydroxy-6-metoxy-1,4-benzoquinol methylase
VTAGQVATREEVQAFLSETRFSGYQRFPLPHGLEVPGVDRTKRADQVFSMDMTGKTVLDVGTAYGFFPYEAVRRGAGRAVGVEINPQSVAVARRIAALHGDRWEVREGRAEEVAADEAFDVVLFLNVLHHVLDPIEAVRRLLAVCRDTMVIEFCRPDDPEYLVHLIDPRAERRRLAWWRARVRSYLLRPALRWFPAMAVGDWVYHRTFYFTPAAFDNLFRVHLGFFESIRFAPTVTGQRRVVAHCTVAQR